jgi:hypothetical protein
LWVVQLRRSGDNSDICHPSQSRAGDAGRCRCRRGTLEEFPGFGSENGTNPATGPALRTKEDDCWLSLAARRTELGSREIRLWMLGVRVRKEARQNGRGQRTSRDDEFLALVSNFLLGSSTNGCCILARRFGD